MIKSYIVTAWRNTISHKLFAIINITGLSVSMSVGLLIVSFVSDLVSYDTFHTKSDRAYRVVTTKTGQEIEPEDYASSSTRAGKLIREWVSGVEHTTVVSTGSLSDISSGEKTVSVATLYADSVFF